MDAADDTSQTSSPAPERGGVWSTEEHDKFIEAITKYPNGPWKTIADYVGTRSVRQVQTHAQKYQEKVARRERGLQKNRQKVVRMEHRVDKATYDFVNRPRAAKGRKPGSKKTSTAPEPLSTAPTTPETWTTVENQNPKADEPMASPPSFNMMELLNSLPGSPMDVESPHLFKEPLMSPPNELLLDFDLESPTPDDTRRFMPSVTLSTGSDECKAPVDAKRLRKTPDPCAPRVQPHEVPTINESLDFFLKLMRVWPHAGPNGHHHY